MIPPAYLRARRQYLYQNLSTYLKFESNEFVERIEAFDKRAFEHLRPHSVLGDDNITGVAEYHEAPARRETSATDLTFGTSNDWSATAVDTEVHVDSSCSAGALAALSNDRRGI